LILRDTHCGAAAIVTVGVCLLIFTATLTSLLGQGIMMALLLAPVLARSAALLLLITTPYARENGLGDKLTQQLSRVACVCVILITFVATIFLLKWKSVAVIAGLMVLVFLLRRLMVKRIGGMTGDTIGALIVLGEMAVLLLSLVSVQY
jgi:adenosylcobinamide-GDP ribazoletransferase